MNPTILGGRQTITMDAKNLYEQLGCILTKITELGEQVKEHNLKIDKLIISTTKIETNLTNHLSIHKRDLYVILSVFGALAAGVLGFLLKVF